MIGIPSVNLENFLLRDLTEKGLKKLGHSIEMCYSNIQKLVLKHLSSVGMALTYQLAEMTGMAKLGGQYEALGFTSETVINEALRASEAFLAKASEIQQVIDHSMRDYKAFFRWLYVVILKLTGERVPPEVSRVSQQDLTFIAEFLRGFDQVGDKEGARKGVNLEKLGQYLRKGEPLQTCLTPDGSEWAAMLSENVCLQNHPLLVRQDLTLSLLQSNAKLVDAISVVFGQAYQGLVNLFIPTAFVTSEKDLLLAVSDLNGKILRMFKVVQNTGTEKTLTVKNATVDTDRRQGSDTKEIAASGSSLIIDLQFYSQDYLSLLILEHHTHSSYFVQLPLGHIFTFDTRENIGISELVEISGGTWPKPVQGIVASRLAVSGARKVAAILSESNRKIRILEIEVEEEDDDEDDEDQAEEADDNVMDTTAGVSTNTAPQCNAIPCHAIIVLFIFTV
ncbi:anaphase-promoting complex subunit 4 [Diprion similis]|uniref:anaphase-promoting complex subunit 4 n=1 Tax=Diprion similis TaxID=362088 RepID=UPI001EF909D8|nr:anaphase-promoting complex subunit 4 [Diprion similis]